MNHDLTVEPAGAGLRRTLSLPLVVLYGLGVTIGAGIYVLVGEAAGRAGMLAPVSFLVAGVVMLFPAAVFAELAGRLPFAAGEARFVDEAFRSDPLTLAVGLAVAAVGIVSAATIALGSSGYILQLIDFPREIVVAGVVAAMGAVAALGIRESVAFAGLMTLIEIAGLLAIIFGAAIGEPELFGRVSEVVPVEAMSAGWSGIAAATLLAVFAFIGFEDMDSIAEEIRDPQRTLARGMFITLGISVVIYMAVAVVAVLAVPPEELARLDAPLAEVFARVTGAPPLLITLIAIVATLNGIIVQFIMVARVFYGLASQQRLPRFLGSINPRTHTPVLATVAATGAVLVLALLFPIGELAEWTSRITLGIFVAVSIALVRIKLRRTAAPPNTFIVPIWVPVVGAVLCLGLLLVGG